MDEISNDELILGIDATNIGNGGGITHLKEFVKNCKKLIENFEITSIIVFASKKTLNCIDNYDQLYKNTHKLINRGLLSRVYFQLFKYDKLLHQKCDILFSITGDYIGSFKPVIGMSRNMLLYERNIWKEIKQPKEIIRFWLNYQKQKRCFKNASGIIFISEYAKQEVYKHINLEKKSATIIHHGVSSRFTGEIKLQTPITDYTFKNPFRFIYVSTVHVYKHQWNVIEAISILRKKGYPVELILVGSVIFRPAGVRLAKAIQQTDPRNEFIHFHGHISYDKIDSFYKIADGIVFASTCENMPNILIESMASGLPIACSDKLPMPEFLKDNGYYFDAKNVESIASAIEKLLLNPEEREKMVRNNLEEVKKYSWKSTANQTIKFINEIYRKHTKKQFRDS